MAIYCKIGRIDFVLYEQIHYKNNKLEGFDSGTQYTLSPECGLARGNPQLPGILDLFSESKISSFNFLVDLKVQPKLHDKNWPVRFGNLQNF